MKRFGLLHGDIIVFFIALIGLIGTYGIINSGLFFGGANKNLMLKISASGEEWLYPLDRKLEVGVEGPLGITHVNINSGSAWVSDSPCTNKLCIKAGKISSLNSWAACLPNKVLIQIIGTQKDGGVDDVSF